MISALSKYRSLQFLLLFVVFGILCLIIPESESNPLWRLPALLHWLPLSIHHNVEFLMNDLWPIQVWDPVLEEFEEQPLLREIARKISFVVRFMIELVRELLLGGVKTIVTFTSWDYVSDNPWARLPAMPWTVVTGGMVILAYALKGTRLAIFTGCAFLYISVFGCLLYTSPSPRDATLSRMPSSA